MLGEECRKIQEVEGVASRQPAWLAYQAPQPFEPQLPYQAGSARRQTSEIVEASAGADVHRGRQVIHVSFRPQLLLGRAKGHEHHIRSCLTDHRGHFGAFSMADLEPEAWGMHASDHQPGETPDQTAA